MQHFWLRCFHILVPDISDDSPRKYRHSLSQATVREELPLLTLTVDVKLQHKLSRSVSLQSHMQW